MVTYRSHKQLEKHLTHAGTGHKYGGGTTFTIGYRDKWETLH